MVGCILIFIYHQGSISYVSICQVTIAIGETSVKNVNRKIQSKKEGYRKKRNQENIFFFKEKKIRERVTKVVKCEIIKWLGKMII